MNLAAIKAGMKACGKGLLHIGLSASVGYASGLLLKTNPKLSACCLIAWKTADIVLRQIPASFLSDHCKQLIFSGTTSVAIDAVTIVSLKRFGLLPGIAPLFAVGALYYRLFRHLEVD